MESPVKFATFVNRRTFRQPDFLIALGLGALTFALYASTAAPGLLDGDPGEFQFAAWRWGLAHPTGYPLYLILGGLWQHGLALFGADPAWALNLLSALFGAATVALLYDFTVHTLPLGPARRPAALFAALLLALNPTFWSQSTIAEVYTLHALLIVLVLRAALVAGAGQRMADDTARTPHHVSRNIQSPCHLVTLSFSLGLALSHHRTALFLLPGLLLWRFWRDRRWWQRGRVWISLLLGMGLPQLLYLYIPLRSGAGASPWLYPRLNGETLALYQQSWQGFLDFITGSVFAVSFLDLPGAVARLAQMAELWLQHFGWLGIALMLFGLITLIRRRQWALLLLTLPFALLLQIFNLFYGIGDIYVFYIPLYLVGSVWAGVAIGDLAIGDWVERRNTHYALLITPYFYPPSPPALLPPDRSV